MLLLFIVTSRQVISISVLCTRQVSTNSREEEGAKIVSNGQTVQVGKIKSVSYHLWKQGGIPLYSVPDVKVDCSVYIGKQRIRN